MKIATLFITLCLLANHLNAQHFLPELPKCQTLKFSKNSSLDSIIIKSQQLQIKEPLKSFCLLFNARNKFKTVKEKSEIAVNAYKIGTKLYRNAKYKEAVDFHSLAGYLWYELDSIKQYCKSIKKIGSDFYRSSDIYNTVKYINISLSLSRENNYKNIEFGSLYQLAWSNWRIGDCDEAIKYLELYKQMIDNGYIKKSLKSYYNSIAVFYKCKGNYPEALKYIDLAINLAKEQNDKRLYGVAITNKADLLIDLNGNPKEIFKMIDQGLKINTLMNDKEQLGSNYSLLAKAHLFNKNYSKAISAALTGLQHSQEIGDLPRIIEEFSYLKQAYYKKGNLKKAFIYSEKYNLLYNELYGSKNIKNIFSIYKKNAEEINKNIVAHHNSERKATIIKNKQNRQIYWLTSIISLLIFTGIIRYFLRSKKNQKQKNDILKEQLTHELLQMEMEALRSRMNPHFIFNSLNAIKSFIISNDVKKSVSYFSKFAKLLRYSLNNSSIDFVSLEDEINFLKDYVALENLRLSNSFTFTIEVADNLKEKSLKVPPLIIQPFIENAIWHGLSLKKINGKLLLKIITNNNFLEIHIIDNGIGRKASVILNKNKTYSSKGISITTKRLAIFSKIHNFEKSFEIIDLNDEKGKANGTKVIIKLPLLYNSKILKNNIAFKN